MLIVEEGSADASSYLRFLPLEPKTLEKKVQERNNQFYQYIEFYQFYQ